MEAFAFLVGHWGTSLKCGILIYDQMINQSDLGEAEVEFESVDGGCDWHWQHG